MKTLTDQQLILAADALSMVARYYLGEMQPDGLDDLNIADPIAFAKTNDDLSAALNAEWGRRYRAAHPEEPRFIGGPPINLPPTSTNPAPGWVGMPAPANAELPPPPPKVTP